MAGHEAAAQTQGQNLAEAHRALLADHTLQFRFDEVATAAPPPRPDLNWLTQLLEAIGPVLRWIFWIGLALLIAAVLFVLAREILARLPRGGRKAKAKEEIPAYEHRPTVARARALLEEADRLAGEGRYSEAARVLLHRSIDDIDRHFPASISQAMTSREIAGLDRLGARTREVFSSIARAVEVSLFGGRDLNAAQYQQCRRIYESFAFNGGKA